MSLRILPWHTNSNRWPAGWDGPGSQVDGSLASGGQLRLRIDSARVTSRKRARQHDRR
jgi:hypothetical protein